MINNKQDNITGFDFLTHVKIYIQGNLFEMPQGTNCIFNSLKTNSAWRIFSTSTNVWLYSSARRVDIIFLLRPRYGFVFPGHPSCHPYILFHNIHQNNLRCLEAVVLRWSLISIILRSPCSQTCPGALLLLLHFAVKLDSVSKVRLLLGLTRDVFKAHRGDLVLYVCAPTILGVVM